MKKTLLVTSMLVASTVSTGRDVASLVEHWAEELVFEVPREAASKHLAVFGAWDDLENASTDGDGNMVIRNR